MSVGKLMIIHLTVELINKISLYKMSYFPEIHTHSQNKMKVELNLPNCATESDLKKAAGADPSGFSKKTDLANLKSDIDNLDIDKLETVSIDLSKLSDVVQKAVYDELVKNVNAIKTVFTNDLVKKNWWNWWNWKTLMKLKKILDHGKYITTQEFNKLAQENFATRLKQAFLASKN